MVMVIDRDRLPRRQQERADHVREEHVAFGRPFWVKGYKGSIEDLLVKILSATLERVLHNTPQDIQPRGFDTT
jgi:hypothetical protein